MKKHIAALMALIMLWLIPAAFATDTSAQIDFAAMEKYTEAWNRSMEERDLLVSFHASDDDGYVSFGGYYPPYEVKPVSIIESLTSEVTPIGLSMQYLSFNNSIAIVYGRSEITEVPKAIEVYTNGIKRDGYVGYYPAEEEGQEDLYTLEFDLDSISAILNAQDVFMRLVTEESSYFQEMNSENMLVPFFMWSVICEGVYYSLRTSPNYLDSDLLPKTLAATAPAAATVPPSVSFQTNYQAIDQAAQSVFLLEVYDKNNNVIATGSGFVAFDSGTLITNEHVIDDAAYIIAYSDQYKASYKLLQLKAVDKNKDIAILEFDAAANVKPLVVDVQSRLLRGQPVTAIGSPKGIINTVSSGNISNIVYYSEEIPDYIQFTAPISPGSSGGALFDEKGAVVGLCVSYLKDGEAMYYAIPMKYVEAMYKDALSKNPLALAQYNNLPDRLPAAKLTTPKLGDGSIELNWNAVSNAEGYEVYRRSSDETDFVLIATTEDIFYSDTAVVIGEKYEYYVRATHSWCSAAHSNTVAFTMIAPTPTPTPKPTKKPTATPVPTITPIPQGKVLYKSGNSDKVIYEIKCRLAELGFYPMSSNFSTKFDAVLKASIKDFQKANKLKVTGVIDENTLTILNSQNAKKGKLTAPEGVREYSKREYQKGESGAEILMLKEELRRLGYYKLTSDFDDEYNSTMVERVKQFQKNNALNPSGTIDYLTLLTMYGIFPQKGSYYESEINKSSAVSVEMGAGLDLVIPQNSCAEWQIVNNKLKFRVQIENVSSKKIISSYSLYVYPADKNGNWVLPANQKYVINGSTIRCGEKKFCDFITMEDANKISSVFVVVYNVKYTDGSSKTTTNTKLTQGKWILY